MTDQEDNQRLHLKLGGISCSFCVGSIEKAVNRHKGIHNVSVSLAHEEVLIEFDSSQVTAGELEKTLTDMGYTIRDPRRVQAFEEQQQELSDTKRKLIISGVITGLALILMILMWTDVRFFWFRYVMLVLALVTMFWPGWFIKQKAWQSLRRGILNQHNLLEFAAFSGLVGGALGFYFPQFPSAEFFGVSVFVTTYHILSTWSAQYVRTRASQAVQELLKLQPDTARIMEDGEETTKDVSEIETGEIVRVRPGERIPVDGKIVAGKSTVDEAIVTGESLPVDKTIDEDVVGGSVNQLGALDIWVTKVGEESFLSQVARNVEEARALKPNILVVVDRVLKYYVPGVVLFGIGAFVFWTGGAYLLFGAVDITRGIFATLAVFVMGYPCALGMAMPLALMRGGGRAAEKGILMRSGESFQILPDVDTVIFDKTGTITEGTPHVVDTRVYNSEDVSALIATAGALEARSEHPLAQAIVDYARESDANIPEPAEFEAVPGEGVRGVVNDVETVVGKPGFLEESGITLSDQTKNDIDRLSEQGQTVVAVATKETVVGIIGIADTVKEGSKTTIRRLADMGIEPVMITGDNQKTGSSVAGEIGIESVFANVSPGDKAVKLRELQQEGRTVAMVGDGINDAPALTQADVGIAIGAGTDIAIESSDVVIMGKHISNVIDAYTIGKESYQKTKQNLLLAFLFNGIGVPAATTGLVHPVWAMVAMAASVTAVLANSFGAQLLRSGRQDTPRSEEPKEGRRVRIHVPGMHCGGCAQAIETALLPVSGVQQVRAGTDSKTVIVSFQPDADSTDEVTSKLEQTYGSVEVLPDDNNKDKE